MANMIEETVEILLGSVRNDGTHQSPLISIVPSILRDLSPKSFNPRVISIGPLNHWAKNVQAFEGHKAKYMHDLFSRLGSQPEETVRACVTKVNALIDRIKACYSAGMVSCSDVELVQMMVKDGCFILEFSHQSVENDDLTHSLLFQSLNLDLLLVENQIPFFVLEEIFQCTILKSEPTASLIEHILPLLEFANIFDEKLVLDNIDATIAHDHILGVLHKCYHPKPTYANVSSFDVPNAHSAVELDRAGVSFKPYRSANWSMAMEVENSWFDSCFYWFSFKRTLKMPVLLIFDLTEVYIRNLIAYEQTTLVGKYVTSYAMAMDFLVDSHEDVAKLVESKVLVNGIGTNEEAANMINNVCKETAFTGFYYSEYWEQLDSYYNGYCPKNIAAYIFQKPVEYDCFNCWLRVVCSYGGSDHLCYLGRTKAK